MLRWEERLAGGVTIEVLTIGDEVVGYCDTARADDPGWGEVRAIYVRPNHQGRGCGSALLDAGMRSLSGAGFSKTLLWVFDRNLSARSFYEGKGWSLGRRIRLEDIGGTQVTLVRYEKNPPVDP